jgi:hypothetical protein
MDRGEITKAFDAKIMRMQSVEPEIGFIHVLSIVPYHLATSALISINKK